jgi:hypothetical protein
MVYLEIGSSEEIQKCVQIGRCALLAPSCVHLIGRGLASRLQQLCMGMLD